MRSESFFRCSSPHLARERRSARWHALFFGPLSRVTHSLAQYESGRAPLSVHSGEAVAPRRRAARHCTERRRLCLATSTARPYPSTEYSYRTSTVFHELPKLRRDGVATTRRARTRGAQRRTSGPASRLQLLDLGRRHSISDIHLDVVNEVVRRCDMFRTRREVGGRERAGRGGGPQQRAAQAGAEARCAAESTFCSYHVYSERVQREREGERVNPLVAVRLSLPHPRPDRVAGQSLD